ncbi:hypothetical protein H6F38_35980, partial [Paenibacillus sp. EKM208P]
SREIEPLLGELLDPLSNRLPLDPTLESEFFPLRVTEPLRSTVIGGIAFFSCTVGARYWP